jgi:hypothetical protein
LGAGTAEVLQTLGKKFWLHNATPKTDGPALPPTHTLYLVYPKAAVETDDEAFSNSVPIGQHSFKQGVLVFIDKWWYTKAMAADGIDVHPILVKALQSVSEETAQCNIGSQGMASYPSEQEMVISCNDKMLTINKYAVSETLKARPLGDEPSGNSEFIF